MHAHNHTFPAAAVCIEVAAGYGSACFSRFYKIDLDYMKVAKKSGAKIFLVINDVTSILSSYADCILMVPTDSMNFCNSTTALNVITEYLLTLISRKCEFKERIDRRDQITEDQRL